MRGSFNGGLRDGMALVRFYLVGMSGGDAYCLGLDANQGAAARVVIHKWGLKILPIKSSLSQHQHQLHPTNRTRSRFM